MARAKLATDRLLECVCVFMCVYVCVFMYVFVCMCVFFFWGGAVHICCRNAGASFNRARCRADYTVHCVASILAVPGLLACHWVHESPLSNSALEPRQFTTLLIQRRKVAARPTARPKR